MRRTSVDIKSFSLNRIVWPNCHQICPCRVKTLMKKTFLPSATNGPLSGVAVVGPDYRTSTVCWKTMRTVSPAGMACLWEIPPAAKAFWRTSVSQRSAPCTVRAAVAAARGASVPRTLNPQPCQTRHLSQCLTTPTRTTVPCPIGTTRQPASGPKTFWSA